MSADRHAARNLVIQVRTGEAVGERITELARGWKVSPNEAARRLLILAAFGLSYRNYTAVQRLADTMGGGSAFLRACDQALAALDSSDHTRSQRGEGPMSEQERVFYLEGWVDQLVEAKQGPKRHRKIRGPKPTNEEAEPPKEGAEPSEQA